MGRIRTIKPEFPQSESIGKLSRDARLLFVQLFTIVDDEGRTRAASRMLASLLYPYDDDAAELIGGWLFELEANGRIVRYEAGGSTYLQITNWAEHQKIDKPSKSKLPAPPLEPDLFSLTSVKPRDLSANSRRAFAEPSPTDMDQERDQGKGSGRENEQDARERANSFARIWEVWPDKVNRKDAEYAFAMVDAPPEEIIAGIELYVRTKPADRHWISLAKFLAQERWKDQPATASASSAGTPVADDRVLIAEDSPELAAWAKHYGKPPLTYDTDQRDKHGRRIRGRYERTRWPPGHDPPAQHESAA